MEPFLAAIKIVAALKSRHDLKQLRAQLEAIESTVNSLGVRIEKVLAIDVAAAYRHLEAAGMATTEELGRNELMLARAEFVRLTERPRRPKEHGEEFVLTDDQVAAIGHAGNFSYFLLNNEPRLALLEAYRCTEQFPALGVQLFPAKIFSRDYSEVGRAMVRRRQQRESEENTHEHNLRRHRTDRAAYYREMAWKVPLAGAVFVGFLAAGAVSPSFAGQAPVRAYGILAGTGERNVTDIRLFKPRFELSAAAIDPPQEVELMRQASTESARAIEALTGEDLGQMGSGS